MHLPISFKGERVRLPLLSNELRFFILVDDLVLFINVPGTGKGQDVVRTRLAAHMKRESIAFIRLPRAGKF